MRADGVPVQIALIGAGRMGRTHLDALERADRIAIVAVVEPLQRTRDELAVRGYRTHADVAELLDAGDVEGVLIAAPSDQHLELVRTCADAGLPMLCEKPVGVAVSDAMEAAVAVERGGVVFQVGYWRRFVPALTGLHERIASGALGEIHQIACMQWDAEPPSASFRAHSGGILVDMAVHELDQARWLTGQEVSWLTAAPSGCPGEVDGDPDAAVILAQLSGGATVTISVGRTFPHGDCCWVELFGSAGYARLPFMWGQDGQEVFRAALIAQAEAFAAAVRGAEPRGAGAADAIAALTAAELAGEALRDVEQRAPGDGQKRAPREGQKRAPREGQKRAPREGQKRAPA